MKGATSSTSALTSPQWCMNTTNGIAVNTPDLFSGLTYQPDAKEREKIRHRKENELIQMAAQGLPIPIFKINERHKQWLSEYKRGVGIVSVARIFGVSKKAVIKALVRTGEYRPDPKYNGPAKKGTGKQSRQPNAGEIKKRESEKRKAFAGMLKLKMSGKPCGNKPTWIKNTIHDKFWKMAENKRSFILGSKVKEKRGHKFQSLRSFLFHCESVFQDHVSGILDDAGVPYDREPMIGFGTKHADFRLGRRYVETKVNFNGQSFLIMLGQLALYRTLSGTSPVLLIPSVVPLRQDQIDVIQSIGAEILTDKSIGSVTLTARQG